MRVNQNNTLLSNDLNMVIAPCKLKQINEIVMWQFAVISRLPFFITKLKILWECDYVFLKKIRDMIKSTENVYRNY